MGTGAFSTRCDRCRVKLDTFNSSNVSSGMSGVLCARCGGIMKREQEGKIRKFTKKAEKRGLVVKFSVDGAGYATMYAVTPDRSQDAAGNAGDAEKGARDDETPASAGRESVASASSEDESPGLLQDSGEGEEGEGEGEAEGVS